MNITTLIEQLQDIAEDHPYAEVQLATQPSWPLAAELGGIADGFDMREMPEGPCPDHGEEGCQECLEEMDPAVIWLVAGESKGYAPSNVFESASF